jgi:hypothetical protein
MYGREDVFDWVTKGIRNEKETCLERTALGRKSVKYQQGATTMYA